RAQGMFISKFDVLFKIHNGGWLCVNTKKGYLTGSLSKLLLVYKASEDLEGWSVRPHTNWRLVF
ncbi:MAG: hypothetical protein ACXV2E_03030, partial [Halobacteriota archaeon]